jgi:hypothetical protein
VDELLTKLPNPNRIELLLGLAHQIWWGYNGDGAKVRAGSVQVAFCAIGKTFELAGLPNPTYQFEGKYWLKIQRQIAAYWQQDPPRNTSWPSLCWSSIILLKLASIQPWTTKESCNMATIAFYFLL